MSLQAAPNTGSAQGGTTSAEEKSGPAIGAQTMGYSMSGSMSGSSPGSMSGSTSMSWANHAIDLYVRGHVLIGDQFSATVSSINGSPPIKQVVWQATGTVESQTYINQSGSYVVQQSKTSQYGEEIAQMPNSADFGTYCDNQPGTHTVTATVTFADGVSTSKTENVIAVAPNVDSFEVIAAPFRWEPDQTGRPGFQCETGHPHTMSATVTVPVDANIPSGGEIGLIQMVNATETITNRISGVHVLNTGGFVLDTLPYAENENGADYLYVDSLESCDNEGTGSFSVNDYPFTTWDGLRSGTDKTTGEFDPVTNVKTSKTIEAHLVFRPSGGIWVNLATASPIVMTGEEEYDFDTDTWSAVSPGTPNNTSPMPTHQDYNIVTWTNWYGNPAIRFDPGWNR